MNTQDEKGYSALHLAIIYNHEDVVDTLLQMRCDVNTSLNHKRNVEDSTKNGVNYTGVYEGITPLMTSCFKGQLSIVKKLLQHDARIDTVDKNNNNALMFAAQEGHNDILQMLLEKNPTSSDCEGHQNVTPLGQAALNGHLKVVEDLIQNWGVNINHQDQFGRTPLISAARCNRIPVVKFLLQNEADASIKTNNGDDALYWARTYKNQEIIKLLSKSSNK